MQWTNLELLVSNWDFLLAQIRFLACWKWYVPSQPDAEHRAPRSTDSSVLSHPAAPRGVETQPQLCGSVAALGQHLRSPRMVPICTCSGMLTSEQNFKTQLRKSRHMFIQYHCRFRQHLSFKDTPPSNTCKDK